MNDNSPRIATEYAAKDIASHDVYVIGRIRNGALEAPTKVGIAQNARSRLRQLQTGSPDKLVLVSCFSFWKRSHAMSVEQSVHRAMEAYRLEGEWFDIGPVDMAVLVDANVRAFVSFVLRPRTQTEQNMSFDYHGPLAKGVLTDPDIDLGFGYQSGAAS